MLWIAVVCAIGLDYQPGIFFDDAVDAIEVNHFFDEHGRHVFDQLIFWKWNPRENCHDVLGWRMLKHKEQVPLRDWNRRGYMSIWNDGGVVRRVRASTLHETWTQFDPEIAERDFLPKDLRRGLSTTPAYFEKR